MGTFAVRESKGIFTIKDMLKKSADQFQSKVAMQIKRNGVYQQITYLQLFDRVQALAEKLVDLGLEKNDRVSIVGENRPEWAISYLAIARAGLTIVPLDPQLSAEKFRHIMEDAGVKYVFASEKFVDDLVEIQPRVETLQKVISMDAAHHTEMVLSMEALEAEGKELVSRGKNMAESRPVELDDLAVILYTSGTTGTSKGVMLSHRNIMSNVDSCYQAILFDEKDVFLSVLPLNHVFEATAGFLVPLFSGSTITYAKSLKSADIVEGIKETGVTVMNGVPLLYEKMLAGILRKIKTQPEKVQKKFGRALGLVRLAKKVNINAGKLIFKGLREKAGLHTIRFFVSGGAALSKETQIGFAELGMTILQGYGLSESAPVLTLNPEGRERLGSIGLPIPNVEVEIYQPDSEGIGEIIARGPNIMVGYYRNPEATAATLRNGWLHTGDLGYKDKDGYIYISGRSKNMIVTKAGKNVYPEEVEQELLKSEYIEEVLVLGKLDPETQREQVHAIVYPNYENVDEYAKTHNLQPMTQQQVYDLIKKEISTYCANLAAYKRVKDFEIREEEFEKTTTKKIKRFLFQQPQVQVNNGA